MRYFETSVRPGRAGRLSGLAMLMALAVSASAPELTAQSSPRLDLGGVVTPGSETERYLRALQLLGAVSTQTWTLLPFTRSDEARLATPAGEHPWAARFPAAGGDVRTARWRVLRPSARLTLNTAFPMPLTDGPTWTGRGLTAETSFGVDFHWRWLDLQLAPTAFIAQNTAFTLGGTGWYGDVQFPGQIDHPQRFGDKAYGRIDPGESSLRITLPGVIFGASTAKERWGNGLILSPNGGGLPHAFIGTSAPVDLWLFTLHARLATGPMPHSAFAATTTHPDRAFSGFVVTAAPRGVPGLEIGAVRWSEMWMPDGGIGAHEILRPFVPGTANNSSGTASPNVTGENQMASAFFRWAPPRSGLEVYGEIYREDWAADLRELLQKPDDLAAVLLGVGYASRVDADAVRVLRIEVVNGELSAQERGSRGLTTPIAPYTHPQVSQGHSVNGRILGIEEAFTGAGTRVSLDRYDRAGRRTISFSRQVRAAWLGSRPDVMLSLRYEQLRFGPSRDLSFTIQPTYELNRDGVVGKSAFNLALGFGVNGFR